ncbi:MAG TPA: MipA/OmpV family protein [Roseateles sp.]|nr:MipA/OmpV family protein [Roseateles sp.]
MNSLKPLPVAALLGLACAAQAQPGEAGAEGARYLLGSTLSSEPEYAGSDRRHFKLRPLWAYQQGRFRLSTGRAGGLLGLGGEASGPGASADLLSSGRLRLGLGLRIDHGRDSADSARLSGLPDVRGTLRGRIYAAYALGGPWSVTGSLSQDLLGREGGMLGGLDLGYRARLGPATEWSASVGLSFGDRRYMRSYFGIGEEVAARSGYAVFEPKRFARDLHAGIGLNHALDRHWLAFGGVSFSTLQADAAASPLTQERSSVSVSVGLAYRWLP